MDKKFDINQIISDAINAIGVKGKKKTDTLSKPSRFMDTATITEDYEPVNEEVNYAFNDEADMIEQLTEYVRYLFETEEVFSQFDTKVDDISFNESVSTIDAVKIKTENNESWHIVFSPAFAGILLDEQARRLNYDIDYDENEDVYPELYFKAFAVGVLYACYLVLVKQTINQNSSSYWETCTKLASAQKTAFSEFKSQFGQQEEYKEETLVLERLLREFSQKI